MTLVTKIEIQNNCYSNNSRIINVNTNNVPFVNNDASYAFYNCNAIKNVYGLNSNITNMSHAFEYTWQNTASYAGVINVTLPTSLQDASYIFKNRPGELEITLPSSITNAYMAFESCYHIKKVTGELYNCSNMQSMYEWALYGTNNSYNLANYTASQAENIDMSRCFYQCQKLQITRPLPPNVTNLSRCFYNTNLTTNLAIPDKVRNMSYCYYRTNISTIPTLPNSVEDISYCFANCNYVTTATVTIPQNVVNASFAFKDVNNITTFNFQSNQLVDMSHFTADVWNDPRLKKLQKVEGFLPTTLRNMHNAFLNSPSLVAFCNSNVGAGYHFPDDIEDMSCCFDLCPNLSGTFYLPTNLVNAYQLHYGSSSKVINYYGTLNKVEDISDMFYSGGINRKINLTISLNNLTNSSRAFQSCTGLTADKITFTGASLNIINAYATFWNDTNLASVPNGFENIKPYTLTFAFGNCSNLFSADFSNMDTSALQNMANAFSYCYKLNTFSIQINNAPSLNLYSTFAYCNALRYLTFNISDCLNVNFENAFYNCQNLTTPPVITNSTATSLVNAFYNCRNLSATSNFQDFYNIFSGATNMYLTFFNCVNANFDNVTIPNTVTNLAGCFMHTKIKKIHIPKTDNEVYISSFLTNCPSLTDVTGYLYAKNWVGGANSSSTFGNRMDNVVNFTVNLGNSMTDISHTFEGRNHGSYGVYGFFKLQHGPVNFGGAVNMSYTFNNCQNLISVGNIPNTVTNMRCCFFYCANLTQVGDTPGFITNLPDSVIVARAAFSECLNLPHLPFPGNSVTDLDNYAFNCQKITSYNYYFPMSVQRMNQTFYNCQNLTGDIRIKSNQISNAINCFMNTSLPKNVYIPFKYANGVYTQTYNTFNAIYGTGANGVTLKNYTELYE